MESSRPQARPSRAALKPASRAHPIDCSRSRARASALSGWAGKGAGGSQAIMTAGSPFPSMAAAESSSSAASAPRSGEEIREAFLNFYAERGHKRMASASLIPDDPTVLLTIAGMLPFKPVFLGQQERPAPRATSSRSASAPTTSRTWGARPASHLFRDARQLLVWGLLQAAGD